MSSETNDEITWLHLRQKLYNCIQRSLDATTFAIRFVSDFNMAVAWALTLALLLTERCNAGGSFNYSPNARFDLQPEGCGEDIVLGRENITVRRGVRSSVTLRGAVLVFLAVGGIAALIATAFHLVRKKVYHDADNLDTTFDAGGRVSIGLTAATIVSQWTWSATLLQSATVAAKYGISGPYWYAAGATIQVILFSALSIQLKIRAPGAKTFLQVIKARFGKRTHIVYCVFAGVTNLLVTASLILAGCEVLHSLIQNLSMELAVILLATIIGGYTLIGGLGATFYVSYFNTATIFIILLVLVVEVFYNPFNRSSNMFGDSTTLYRYLKCTVSPEGNTGRSYLTFGSSGGLLFGIITIISGFGTVFCDQSYWQSSVAAKPMQGVWGFILGGLTWFAIPFTMATTMGLAYLALSARQGEPLLSPVDVDRGLVTPAVVQMVLGRPGEYAVITLLLMAIMSTGSAEVIAVASIIIYDIYQIYIQPFRWNVNANNCVLCDLPYESNVQPEQKSCSCKDVSCCEQCKIDAVMREANTRLVPLRNICVTHGEYKEYMDQLLHYKNWSIVWTTLFIIPLLLICYAADLNLSWIYLSTGVLISSSVIPVVLTIFWSRLNDKGMISGAIGGLLCGTCSWLAVSSTYPGGLSKFLENTGHDMPMLIGNVVSISVGGLLCIIVSLVTNRQSNEQLNKEWERTRNIDNPLNPWSKFYKGDLSTDEKYHSRPSLDSLSKTFRRPKIISYTFGILLTIIFIFVWPGGMMAMDMLDLRGFVIWTSVSRIWSFIAAAFIIVLPLLQEIIEIKRQLKRNKQENNEFVHLSNNLQSKKKGLQSCGVPD